MNYSVLKLTFLSAIYLSLSPTMAKANFNDSNNTTVSETIKLNQLGYLVKSDKIAIVPNVPAKFFEIVNVKSNDVVYKGELSTVKVWESAGSDHFKQANFTQIITPGEYVLRVEGVDDSPAFSINDHVFDALHIATLKYYYLNRASTKIDKKYAGIYARPLAHKDDNVIFHGSAEAQHTEQVQHKASQKGWYDAGDYGKYVVNSGITTYTLLAAFEHYPLVYQKQILNIPESSDNIPDIINEVTWNLDWLVTMQSDDGGVYHKLTTREWPGAEMPQEDNRARYIIGKSTSASLNFAATFALASRVIAPYSSNKAKQYLTAAVKAWNWSLAHQAQYYIQPKDVKSGEYGDTVVNDEFSWAAAELFITTKQTDYFNAYQALDVQYSIPSWNNVSYLGLSSLLFKAKALLTEQQYQTLKLAQKHIADNVLSHYRNSEYKVAMQVSDFIWGSNAIALNKAIVLLDAAQLNNDQNYIKAAQGLIDYILGRNPTGYSFVTGFGTKTPMQPHHRISQSDNIKAPLPGMLVGGPNAGQQDKCNYESNEPAKSYSDSWCSYSTNEVAINWNAPLVYALGALISLR